jgi:hypothetical protein
MSDDTKPTNLPPPCVKRPAIGEEVTILNAALESRIGERCRVLGHSAHSDYVSVETLDGSDTGVFPWRSLGLASEQPKAALPPPCTERPPVDARVVVVRPSNADDAGRIFRVARHLHTDSLVTVEPEGDPSGRFVLPWRDLGLAPEPKQPPPWLRDLPVAPPAPAGDVPTFWQRLEKLEEHRQRDVEKVQAQRAEEAEQEQRINAVSRRVQALEAQALDQRISELAAGLRSREKRLQVVEQALDERCAASLMLKDARESSERGARALAEWMASAQERFAKLEGQAGYVADLSVRVQALEALPVAQGLHPVAGTGLAQTLMNQRDAAIQERDRLAAELRGRSACDAAFGENTKRLMGERDAACEAVRRQQERAEAAEKLAEERGDDADELRAKVAELTKERDEARKALADAVEQLQAANANFDTTTKTLQEQLNEARKDVTALRKDREQRQKENCEAEIKRLLTLIPESDPRRDPDWKPEEAPRLGDPPAELLARIDAHKKASAEEVAARAKAAGVHPAIAEVCERIAANAPAFKTCDRVRVIKASSCVHGVQGKIGTVTSVRGGNVDVVLEGVEDALRRITCPPDYLERVAPGEAGKQEFRQGDRVRVVDKTAGGSLTGCVGTVRFTSENGVSVSFEHRHNELFLFLPAHLEIARQYAVVVEGTEECSVRPGVLVLVCADQSSTAAGWKRVQYDGVVLNVPDTRLAFVQEPQP